MSELKSFIVLYGGKFIRVYKENEADKVIAEKDKELRHHKYKRCLAMAKLCNEKWLVHNFAEIPTKLGFYDKWEKRFIELAEKFKDKEAK